MLPETVPALKNEVLFPVLTKSCCAVTTKSHNVPELLSNSQSRSPSPLMVTPELIVTLALSPLISRSAQLAVKVVLLCKLDRFESYLMS